MEVRSLMSVSIFVKRSMSILRYTSFLTIALIKLSTNMDTKFTNVWYKVKYKVVGSGRYYWAKFLSQVLLGNMQLSQQQNSFLYINKNILIFALFKKPFTRFDRIYERAI